MAAFDVISLTPSSAVATDATMTFTYPSGNASRYAKSGEKLVIKGLQNTLAQAADTFTLAYGASSVVVTYKDATSIPAGTEVQIQLPLAEKVGVQVITIPAQLAAFTTAAADLITNYVPGFAFKLLGIEFVTTTLGTGTSASMVFNAEIGTTNVTGGVLTLLLADTDTLGKKTAATAITGANTGSATDTLSLEVAASGTVFTAGAGYFLVKLQNLDTLAEFEDRVAS